jgi:hypothetical protein
MIVPCGRPNGNGACHGSTRRTPRKCHFDSPNGILPGSQRLFFCEIQAIHGSLSLVRDLLIFLMKVRMVKVMGAELLQKEEEAYVQKFDVKGGLGL